MKERITWNFFPSAMFCLGARRYAEAAECAEPLMLITDGSKSIETLLPILQLKGISTSDFSEALAALLVKDAPGLSPTAIVCLKDGWLDEYDAWQKRDLSTKHLFSAVGATIESGPWSDSAID